MSTPLLLNTNMRFFGAKKTKGKKSEKSKKEKDEIKEQFADVDTDDIKNEFISELELVLETLEENLGSIKSGRATNDAFDDIQVKAYGEMCDFADVA